MCIKKLILFSIRLQLLGIYVLCNFCVCTHIFYLQFCTLSRLSHEVGWKYQTVIATLELKRKAKANVFYARKKKDLVSQQIFISDKSCTHYQKTAKILCMQLCQMFQNVLQSTCIILTPLGPPYLGRIKWIVKIFQKVSFSLHFV